MPTSTSDSGMPNSSSRPPMMNQPMDSQKVRIRKVWCVAMTGPADPRLA